MAGQAGLRSAKEQPGKLTAPIESTPPPKAFPSAVTQSAHQQRDSGEPPAQHSEPSASPMKPPAENPAADSPASKAANAAEVLPFPAKKPRRGRPAKSATESYRVSVEKVSLNTYAIRIRWKRADGTDHPGVVVNRLNDAIIKEIKRSKKRYEQFKSQTLSSRQSRTIRQGDEPRTNSRRAV